MNRAAFMLPAVAGVCVSLTFGQERRTPDRMEGTVHRGSRRGDDGRTAALDSIRALNRPARRVSLGRLRAEESRPRIRKPGLNAVGVSRAVPEDVLARGEWSVAADGRRIWQLALESTGAEAMRVHFANFHVASGSVWVVEPAGGIAAGPYSGEGPHGDGEFWSDLVSGDSLIVAWEPAADVDATSAPPFQIAEISHRTARAAAVADTVQPLAAAASCTLDVTCHPDYSEPASAVALIIFESEGSTYECSGALINSAVQPAVPFFMTANHCVSTAEEARSVIAVFNYQTPSCGGQAPAFSRLPRVTGSTFVAGHGIALGDFSLLRLSAFPSIDVKVLGWSGAEIALNQRVTGISHPRGDYKRISFGERTRDVTIRFEDGERMPANKGYQIDWLQGVTQSGSSGSPLLAEIGGAQYFVGTLTAGPIVDEDNSAQVCRTSNLHASYGRFSAALPYLEEYLRPGSNSTTSVRQGTITASPSMITLAAGQTAGRTTLSWSATGVTRVQVRVGSPAGVAMTGFEGPTGSAPTGDWVTDGTTFYLQDASDGDSAGAAKTVATVIVRVASSSVRRGTLLATPNPVTLANGAAAGRTTLRWTATGVTRVQIRVGSATGRAMTGFENANGSALTGDWVVNGTTFYLQDGSSGNSSGAARTLATVTVRVTGS